MAGDMLELALEWWRGQAAAEWVVVKRDAPHHCALARSTDDVLTDTDSMLSRIEPRIVHSQEVLTLFKVPSVS